MIQRAFNVFYAFNNTKYEILLQQWKISKKYFQKYKIILSLGQILCLDR